MVGAAGNILTGKKKLGLYKQSKEVQSFFTDQHRFTFEPGFSLKINWGQQCHFEVVLQLRLQLLASTSCLADEVKL